MCSVRPLERAEAERVERAVVDVDQRRRAHDDGRSVSHFSDPANDRVVPGPSAVTTPRVRPSRRRDTGFVLCHVTVSAVIVSPALLMTVAVYASCCPRAGHRIELELSTILAGMLVTHTAAESASMPLVARTVRPADGQRRHRPTVDTVATPCVVDRPGTDAGGNDAPRVFRIFALDVGYRQATACVAVRFTSLMTAGALVDSDDPCPRASRRKRSPEPSRARTATTRPSWVATDRIVVRRNTRTAGVRSPCHPAIRERHADFNVSPTLFIVAVSMETRASTGCSRPVRARCRPRDPVWQRCAPVPAPAGHRARGEFTCAMVGSSDASVGGALAIGCCCDRTRCG